MKIRKATAKYETWLSRYLKLIPADVELKHERMREDRFAFLRATYYRWAQLFPEVCDKLDSAPKVLGVGDLHVENFGTWRDMEGRLIWGINDFDEAWRLPYTHDLVRLAASANMAIEQNHLALDASQAADAILGGYRESLEKGGRAFVLAESHGALRTMATHRLRDPQAYWEKLDRLQAVDKGVPAGARQAMAQIFPERRLDFRVVHRIAGLGSLGRQRFLAIAHWRGGHIAREAKALAPSACLWACGGRGEGRIHYQEVLERSVRALDPFVRLKGRWIVRRLAPDCSRIELPSLPEERDELRLLHAMGFETANVHLGTSRPKALLRDLQDRPRNWLHKAGEQMVAALTEDWEQWRKAGRR